MTEEERNRTANAINRWVAHERLETVRLMAQRNAKEASPSWERDLWEKIGAECSAAIEKLTSEAKEVARQKKASPRKMH